METYTISFRGETLPGHDPASVKRRFTKLFRIDPPEKTEAFFSGEEIILRRNLDRDQAAQAFVTLRKIGMVTHIAKAGQEDTRLRPEPTPEPVSPFMEYKPNPVEAPDGATGNAWYASRSLIESLAAGSGSRGDRQPTTSKAPPTANSLAGAAPGPEVSTPRQVKQQKPAKQAAAEKVTEKKDPGKKPPAEKQASRGVPTWDVPRKTSSAATAPAEFRQSPGEPRKPTAKTSATQPAATRQASARKTVAGSDVRQQKLAQTSRQKSANPRQQAKPTGRPAASGRGSATGKPRRKRQAGAPNLFDVRLSDRALGVEAMPSQLLQVSQAPMIAAAIVMFALLLVGVRFWIDSQSSPAYGIGSVAIDPSQRPVVEVNDQLLLHDRAGIDTDNIPLADLGATPGASFDFFSDGDVLLRDAPDDEEHLAQLARCDLAERSCEVLRRGLGDVAFVVERRTDTIYLADASADRLQKLDAAGNELAVQRLELAPPVSITVQEGLLYITQGGSDSIQVRRPETAEFGTELDSIALQVEGASQSGHLFPTDLAWSGNAWWVIMRSRDGSTGGVYQFSPRWEYRAAVDLGADAHPAQLVNWADKLLVPDNRNGLIYRVDGQGRVEKPFNEQALQTLLQERRSEMSLTRSLQIIVLLILFIAAAGLLALGTLQSLQRKLYRPASDTDEANFDISDEAIEWLDPAPDTQRRLRHIGYAIAGISCLVLVFAVLADFGIWSMTAVSLVLAGLGGYYFALQQCSGCHLGLLGDKLILVDHNNTYRIGRGPKIQYVNNFIMIDDVIVYLGNRLVKPFAGEQLRHQFEPIVTRGIRVDGTTLQLKLIDTRHPMLFGAGGLIVACCFALLLLLLS